MSVAQLTTRIDQVVLGGNTAVAEWFIQNSDPRGAPELGPFRPNELLEMVRSGEVGPDTIIRKNDSSWFQAAEVGGLFEAAMRPTIHHFCPHCTAPVPEPPCSCPKCDTNLTRTREEIKENSIVSQDDRAQSGRGQSVQEWLKRKVGKKK